MNATALIFGSFALFLLLYVPIAISIGLSSICYIYFFGGIKYTYLATTLFTANDSFPLMAIPFFILSGALMEGGGLSRKLCNIADSLVGHMTGGFAIVTIITCTFLEQFLAQPLQLLQLSELSWFQKWLNKDIVNHFLMA